MSLPLLTIFAKRLYLRFSTRFSIPIFLKLIKTPEQPQANHSYDFIVNFEGRFPNIEINRWLNTLLKFLSRKIFYIKKCFPNDNNDSRIHEMLYSKVSSCWVINRKEGFRFNIYCCLKIWQNFEMEVCLLRGRGNISIQVLLSNSKVNCRWSLHIFLYLNAEAM